MSSTDDGRPAKSCFSDMMVAEKETRARVALRGTAHPIQAVPDSLVNRLCASSPTNHPDRHSSRSLCSKRMSWTLVLCTSSLYPHLESTYRSLFCLCLEASSVARFIILSTRFWVVSFLRCRCEPVPPFPTTTHSNVISEFSYTELFSQILLFPYIRRHMIHVLAQTSTVWRFCR